MGYASTPKCKCNAFLGVKMTKRLEDALYALETFSELGLSLAPADPTDYMCYIGASVGNADLETAKKIYRVMIDAALDEYCDPQDPSSYPGLPFKFQ